MWPLYRNSSLPAWIDRRWIEWVQNYFVYTLLVLSQCLSCLKTDLWGNSRDMWRWRRMWKTDAKFEEQERIRRERCCAKDRDDWREKARQQGLIPQKTSFLRKMLYVRDCRFWTRKSMINLIQRFGDTRLKSYMFGSPFLKLPPEIREQIYVYYILEWSCTALGSRTNQPEQAIPMPMPPHEPPLTRVSKLLRAESLHVFYRTARFPLIVHPARSWGPMDLPMSAVDWYHFLDPEKLSLIRHLELHLCLRRSVTGVADSLVFHVDLEHEENKVTLVHAPWALPLAERHQGSWMAKDMQRFLDELLHKFREAARSLGNAGIVSAKDIYQFVS